MFTIAITKTMFDNRQFRLTAVIKNGAGAVLADAVPVWSASPAGKVQLVPDATDPKVCLVKAIPGQTGTVNVDCAAGSVGSTAQLTILSSAPASVTLSASSPDEPLS